MKGMSDVHDFVPSLLGNFPVWTVLLLPAQENFASKDLIHVLAYYLRPKLNREKISKVGIGTNIGI